MYKLITYMLNIYFFNNVLILCNYNYNYNYLCFKFTGFFISCVIIVFYTNITQYELKNDFKCYYMVYIIHHILI